MKKRLKLQKKSICFQKSNMEAQKFQFQNSKYLYLLILRWIQFGFRISTMHLLDFAYFYKINFTTKNYLLHSYFFRNRTQNWIFNYFINIKKDFAIVTPKFYRKYSNIFTFTVHQIKISSYCNCLRLLFIQKLFW